MKGVKITWLLLCLKKNKCSSTPQYISKMSIKSSDVHSYSLRHAQDSLSFQDQIAKLSNIAFPIEGHFVGIV